MLEKTPVATILFAVSLPAVIIRKNQILELSVK
jgi:NADH:ubiquinone oxidoreductase subunit K